MSHHLNAIQLGNAIDYAGIAKMRPTKNKGSVIGCKGKNAKKPIKPVSPKQRARTGTLQDKLKRMTIIQELHGYNPHCQKCLRAQYDGHPLKLYFCHIEPRGRHKPGVDSYSNGWVGCSFCNGAQGSKVEDPAPTWFREEMRKLDRQ